MSTVETLESSIHMVEPEKYEALPDIELYMDQLVEYLSRTPMSLRRGDKLTGAMVNNYIKSGLLPRAKGKRYSRQHIADLAMIVRLKQVLSVSDTGCGIPTEELAAVRSAIATGNAASRGFGLSNIQKRVQLDYGPRYGLAIDSREGEGTEVTLRIRADCGKS